MRAPWPLRALLRLYPASFRMSYGDELERVYLERRRDAHGARAVLGLWLATLVDTVWAAGGCHADTLRQDLGYALRGFRRAPGFTATVVVVAALGIGANTAAFSLTNHVLLRPLPFADPERLVALWETQLTRKDGGYELSPLNYRDWRALARSFAGMGAYTLISTNLVGEGPPERLDGAAVSADLLPLLGVAPLLGRTFTPEDDRDGAPGTVLLGHGLWQTAFGGAPDVVGRTVTLDGERVTIVGVMPRSFVFPSRDTQLWRPIRFNAEAFEDRTNTYLRVVGRLKPGVDVAAARAELAVIAENLERAYPKENARIGAVVNPLHDELGQKTRALVLALLGAAACVLLIACLNLANLLLGRALARRKELALRTALGAGRERLVRQLVTESLVLALAGGVLGVLLALAALPLLARLVPPWLPTVAEPALDLRVLAVAAAATAFAGLVFGVVPALRACGRLDAESLGDGARAGAGRTRTRLRRALVVAEVGVSLVLLVSSGLLLRALWRIEARDPGFRADGVLTLRTTLPWPKYEKTPDRTAFYDRVLARARALPGVTDAAYTSFLPMVMGGGIWTVELPDRPRPEAELGTISLRYVTPRYFATLGIPLRAGRDVEIADGADRPFVAVVSESMARRYWPGEDPLGKTIKTAFFERKIVGVVGDVRVRGLERDSEPQVYVPYQQIPDGWMPFYAPKDLVVRAAANPAALAPALRAVIGDADADEPVADVRLLDDIVDAQTAPRRVQLDVIGTFAALAFLLAAIGIYGLLSFAVANRRQEIGVRMALGATPASILAMVLREGLLLAAIGAALGLALAAAAGRALEALLVGVEPTDAAALAAALALALVMTLAGSFVPAWRAARVDPASVMRAD
jgi:putative ABC transport system permease protein